MSTFSIITVCFNAQKTIASTINSVLNQTEKDFEYIIIDGNSFDKTVEIIKSFEKKFKDNNCSFRWISEPDNGIYDAFNKGVQLAKGNWISFLGADDLYYENAIEIYKNNLPDTAMDLLYSEVNVANKRVIKGVWSWSRFRRKMNIAHVGAFHHKFYFKRVGLFDTSYKIAGDYELLLRAGKKLKTKKINTITAYMSDGGVSNNQVKKVLLETMNAKIATKSVIKFIAVFDYIVWIIKLKIKKILSAFYR